MSKKIYNILFEQESTVDTPERSMQMTDTKFKARKALDSVDDQIDALIIRYESSSIREEDKKVDGLLESLQNNSLKYLFEQDDEPVEDDFGDDAGSDVSAEPAADDSEPEEVPDPEGSEKITVDEPGEERVPDLDIDAFAARTVRLIVNYKNLLRIEEAIGNRVKHFLDVNYGDKFVQRYMEILENQYGIVLSEFEDERNTSDEDFAVGAFAGGTGGLGGGG